ncbi:sugar phosphate isomerase/epimerase family protein [Nioella sp.]|uniref:sugar phosphate isomerase/epimerase family protein n=1 Tax=Nioella sp. TaxID=1912091 RepID=UPI003B52D23E
MNFGKNPLGIHALCIVGGWSEAEARQAISTAAATGYDLIEIPMLDPDKIDVAMTARLLEEYGIAPTISLGLGPTSDLSSEDPDIAARGEALLGKVVSIGRDIGSTHLCGVIYSAMTKYGAPASRSSVEQSAEALSRICAAAAASDIQVGVEVVNRYETNIANTAAEGVALCKMIGAPNARVHLDTYHMNIEEADMARAIVETGDMLGYFHLGESHRGYLGTGSIDFAPAFEALAQIDYSGPLVFESFSSEIVDPQLSNILGVWRNLWTDGGDLIGHARDFMKAHIKAAAQVNQLMTSDLKGDVRYG